MGFTDQMGETAITKNRPGLFRGGFLLRWDLELGDQFVSSVRALVASFAMLVKEATSFSIVSAS